MGRERAAQPCAKYERGRRGTGRGERCDMAHVKDMTRGSPWRLIILFALPLMLGNVFQQLYTLVDTAVVGRYVGVEALASLGAADWLNWMVLGIPAGFAQGFSILMSQHFGAGDRDGLRRSVAQSIELSAAIAVVTLAVSQALLEPMLRLLGTPDNVLPGSLLYLRIYFSGIPITMAFNLLSSMLRALGDGRTPLKAMIVAALLNVGLDLLFTIAFGWGVAGVAIATVMAQCVAMLYCLRVTLRLGELKLSRAHFEVKRDMMAQLMRLGAPVALQNTIISVGGLCVQYVVNGFGFMFIAGFTTTNKLYGLLEMAAVSFGYAISTYTGQNLGARNYTRIRRGVRASVKMSLITSVAIGATMLLLGRMILAQFVSGNPDEVAQVLDIAYTYLTVMASCLPILYLLYVYRSAQQGMGDTVIPMISGAVELIMRVGAALLLPMLIGPSGIYVAEVAAWTGAAVLLILAYYKKARAFPPDAPGSEA